MDGAWHVVLDVMENMKASPSLHREHSKQVHEVCHRINISDIGRSTVVLNHTTSSHLAKDDVGRSGV